MNTNLSFQSLAAVRGLRRIVVLVISVFLIIMLSSAELVQSAPPRAFVDSMIYLPLLRKNFPTTPAAPTLSPISNPDGDGSYMVSWSASSGATGYLLQESTTQDFSSASTTYSGSTTSAAISGKTIGRYYYRVQASSGTSSSAWSNIEAVDVTEAGDTISDGDWYGETSWIEKIDLSVVGGTTITTLDIVIDWNYTCGYGTQNLRLTNIPVSQGAFSVPTPLLSGLGINGTFSSPVSVGGSFTAKVRHPTTLCQATMTGSWEAMRPAQGYSIASAIAVQPDGKVVIGGEFTMNQGQPQSYLARFNPDGSLDSSFNPGGNDEVLALALQPDGKILVGGLFTEMGGQPRNHIARLNPDGSLDTSFNPGADTIVTALVVQADEKILVGGEFEQLDGQPCAYLGRLNENGNLDISFDPQLDFLVYALAIQPDQNILVGGTLDVGPGVDRGKLIRLDPNGSLEEGFSPIIDERVTALAVQGDGKILLGGIFNFIGEVRRNYLARLQTDSNLEEGFDPNVQGTSFSSVKALAVQPDQKILVGGNFSIINDQTAYRIGRVNPDGSLDTSFSGRTNGGVEAVAVQPDGKVWIGGYFYYVNGQVALGFTRLNPNGTLDEIGR